jgi:hypothetical protein
MISDQDVQQLLFTDCAEEAFKHIVKFWEENEVDGLVPLSPRKSTKRNNSLT